MQLLFISNEFVAKSWFISFEVNWASEDTKIGQTRFASIAVIERCGWVSIGISDVLGWTGVDNGDSVCVCMVKESAAKSSSVEKGIRGVMNFAPFGFADAIHFLMFRRGCF